MAKTPKLLLLGLVTFICTAGEPLWAVGGTGPGRAQQQPAAAGPPFTLRLSADRETLTSGSPARATVITTNTSSLDLYFAWIVNGHPSLAYQEDASALGGSVPPTHWHGGCTRPTKGTPRTAQRVASIAWRRYD